MSTTASRLSQCDAAARNVTDRAVPSSTATSAVTGPAGGAQGDHRGGLVHLDHARFHHDRCHAHTSVSTYGKTPGNLDVQHSHIGVRMTGGCNIASFIAA